MVIKAIDTEYKGYKFRSRLEARWAVFFDALGLVWEYELEGYVLPSGKRYLPDFKVFMPSGLITFFEIKPRNTPLDKKFLEFRASLNEENEQDTNFFRENAVQVNGDPLDMYNQIKGDYGFCFRCGEFKEMEYGIDIYDGQDFVLVGCQRCDFTTVVGVGETEKGLFGLDIKPYKGMLTIDASDYRIFLTFLNFAAKKSRQKRFEHGN